VDREGRLEARGCARIYTYRLHPDAECACCIDEDSPLVGVGVETAGCSIPR